MTLTELKNEIPDYGRDMRLNLDALLGSEDFSVLSANQTWGVALACAYALEDRDLVAMVLSEGRGVVDDSVRLAAQTAATIMAMNNVYYRSIHLMEDLELKALPARLRMNGLAKPPVARVDFELMSLGVSALAGCGQCLTAHQAEVVKGGVSLEGVQMVLRIAAVLNGARRASAIGKLG